ncbi:MAG: ribosome small subunit-dependent GTPase A [Bacillota bacterium]
MEKGVIVKGIGGFYYIDTESGVYETRARGIFRKRKIQPLVGDIVEMSIIDENEKTGSLDVILPRKNMLIRPKVANIDQAVIVFGAKEPDINLDLLDRFLILVEEQHLDIVVVINKIDIDSQKDYEPIAKMYQKAGYQTICTSAEQHIGIEALKEALHGKTSVFAGPSGVGKSTLLNTIFPELDLQTGAISEKIKRGKHTTRHAELIAVMEGSYIVDSPGFTSLYLTHIPSGELQNYFREFAPFQNECYYNGCAHINEPDCKVKAEIGTVIDEARYKRYQYIYEERKEEERRR